MLFHCIYLPFNILFNTYMSYYDITLYIFTEIVCSFDFKSLLIMEV